MSNKTYVNYNFMSDPGGDPGEHRLVPYVQLGGPNQYTINRPSLQDAVYSEENSPFPPIKRFTLATAPLQDTGDLNYPNYGSSKWMINLDNEQLYTASRESPTSEGFGFGEPWVAPSKEDYNDCRKKYGTGDGAYTIPVPVQGLPIEFRKVYFKGVEVDEYGCTSGSGSGGCNTYYAYLPCSLPVKQTCASGTGASGYTCNPRNENYGIMEGEVAEWSGFDIGCGGGGGGGGCADVYSMVSGLNWTGGRTGVFSSGCGAASGFESIPSTITFIATGTATGHTSGNFKFALRSHEFPTGDYAESGIVGPQFLVHQDGLGHVFTGFTSTHSGEYKAINRSDHFTFKGVSGIKTLIQGRRLHIGGPNFTSSGCLNVTTTTSTNTVTYGIDKSGIINCLGFEPNRVRMLIATGTYPDGPADGPVTSLTGDAGQPYFSLCEFTLLTRCPQDEESMLSGCCVALEGACCIPEVGCVLRTEDDCNTAGGYYHGDGSNCTDILNDGESAPFYGYTLTQLCEEGIGCVYNNDYKPGGGTSMVGYECYNGGLSSQTTRRDYLNHIYSDDKYHPDEWEGEANPSTFHVGKTCVSHQCPTTTSTSTSTTSTSTSTTTPS